MPAYLNRIHTDSYNFIKSDTWYNHGSTGGSNIYLRTPLYKGHGNMFHITIRTYEYGGSYNGVYNFGGYCYAASSSLISTRMQTLSNSGRSISMGTNSGGYVYCQISGSAVYYGHFTFEYIGWAAKDVDDFSWHNSAG